MWRPNEVVEEHKCRATTVWVGLIAAIISYSVYLVYAAVLKSENPSTSYVLSNDLYNYPDVYVCLYDFLGCDSFELEESCRESAFDTGQDTQATFNPGGTDEQEIGVGTTFLSEKGHCIKFNTSDVEFSAAERDPEDYVQMDMYWYPGGAADESRTCVEEEGTWQTHRESVTIFLRDPDTGELSAGSQIPYTCITKNSNQHAYNFVGIGLTTEVPLDGEARSSYKALTIITSTNKEPTWQNVSAPFAYLSIELAQSVDSLEIITEISPWEIAEIFGNVGGFWDLLLFCWPLFFVSIVQSEPGLKARDFKKALQWRQRGRLTLNEEEERPDWDQGAETYNHNENALQASRRIPTSIETPVQRSLSRIGPILVDPDP